MDSSPVVDAKIHLLFNTCILFFTKNTIIRHDKCNVTIMNIIVIQNAHWGLLVQHNTRL